MIEDLLNDLDDMGGYCYIFTVSLPFATEVSASTFISEFKKKHPHFKYKALQDEGRSSYTVEISQLIAN